MKQNLLGVAAIAAAVTFGASFPASAQAPVRGGSIIFTLGGDPTVTNPVVSSGVPEGLIGCILYQGLAIATPSGGVNPMLAKSWSISPDGKTYTFELEKAQWQDGKPFTSEDVKYSLTEVNAKYSAIFAGAGRTIDSIETPAPDKAIVHLKQPYGPFMISQACSHGGSILPAHIFRGTNPLQNPASGDKPVGIGPFALTEWKRGDYIRLARNPNYREPGKPLLDELVAKIITQSSARVQALQAGEVDHLMYFYLPANNYDQVRANPALSLTLAKVPAGIDVILLNVGRKPLDDKRVRQALLTAIDRDYLIRNAFFNVGEVGTMPFTNGITWAADPSVDYRKMYAFNTAKANAMLDEAGVKRGPDGIRFKANIVYSADQADYALMAQAVKSMWAAVGVELSIEAGDRAIAYKRMFETRDYDASIGAYNGYSDPALGMARMVLTSSLGRTLGNGSGYSNPAMDDLLDRAEKGTTEAARTALYQEAQRKLADELPILTIHERILYDASSKRVRGLENEVFLGTWRDAWRAN